MTRKYKFFPLSSKIFTFPTPSICPVTKCPPILPVAGTDLSRLTRSPVLRSPRFVRFKVSSRRSKEPWVFPCSLKVRQQPLTERLAPASRPSFSSKGNDNVKHHDSFSSTKDSTFPTPSTIPVNITFIFLRFNLHSGKII